MEIYSKFVNAQTCKMNICTFLKITISEQINGKKLINKKKKLLVRWLEMRSLGTTAPPCGDFSNCNYSFFPFSFLQKEKLIKGLCLKFYS